MKIIWKHRRGKSFPFPTASKDSGWELRSEMKAIRDAANSPVLDKVTFGAKELPAYLEAHYPQGLAEVELIGLCTDICVISNALLLKAFLPEVPLAVDAACCAGVNPESHRNALKVLKMCQVRVYNE